MKRNGVHMTLEQVLQTNAGKHPKNAHLKELIKAKPKKRGHVEQDSPEKQWIQDELQFWCNKNLLELHTEYRFAPPRLFRFDWAVTAPAMSSAKIKIAIEYEGIYSEVSRHTTKKGYARDVEKYNEAAKLGWQLIRLTAGDYKTVIESLNRLLCS